MAPGDGRWLTETRTTGSAEEIYARGMSDAHDEVSRAVSAARTRFESGRTRPLAARRRNLRALRKLITENEREFARAVHQDLGKSATETGLMEISIVLGEVSHALRHLRRWQRPKPVRLPVTLWPGHAHLAPEPLGVVLILAPWNYPIQLLLAPLAGALAVGNTAVLKPSSQTVATSGLLVRLIPRYFPDGAVTIVDGQTAREGELLKRRFDHIIFTGSADFGHEILRAAAEHLTSVTLELGGKSPAWFDDDRHIDRAARRLAWAKFSNAGQTCVAPDYVMTTPDRVDALAAALGRAIWELWGDDPRTSPDYGRIISAKHVDRLASYLDDVDVRVGGQFDRDDRYVAPTVVVVGQGQPVVGAEAAAAVMRREIFGPILPVVSVASPQAAADAIKGFEKPLAMYVFSGSRRTRRLFERATSSGAMVHGAGLVQLAASGLPFGGVGGSGMGAYHGEYSFKAFSHAKPVLTKPLRPDVLRLVQPPYPQPWTGLVQQLMRRG
ncbi:aldehyde dehydrogenase family protein [Propionimicrobium sp. PCR01-08-3]|uniref:aldehyde dehydrogenase family protein n=1 Tax=Propionimicrobium sp. PCR01-08-3 TaxID=3052086 RepID=UPI00255C6F53|nr:aldehyde dehydrogenase family protein [Propionimicrobium sp. PCR01-08-3]WIY81816.1 aldehyde dehydrogenase family protein [Propionimicrobium sp. PCR01-08-3]